MKGDIQQTIAIQQGEILQKSSGETKTENREKADNGCTRCVEIGL